MSILLGNQISVWKLTKCFRNGYVSDDRDQWNDHYTGTQVFAYFNESFGSISNSDRERW